MVEPVQQEFKTLLQPKISFNSIEDSWKIILSINRDNICIIHRMRELSPLRYDLTWELKIVISLDDPKIYLETVQLNVIINFIFFLLNNFLIFYWEQIIDLRFNTTLLTNNIVEELNLFLQGYI